MSAPAVIDRVKRNLVGLKMPRALEILDVTVRGIERGEITAIEAIDALLTEELTLRENRRVKMALQMAKLSAIKTLTGFDFAFQPSLDRNRVLALAQLQFIDRAEAVHLIGPPGTGKTHLSLALGVEAVKAGRSVYFSSLADIVASLARAEREGALRERIRYFCRFALLIVDEIGYLPVIPGGGNLFFQLVNARYERGAMILTSNRGFAEWGDIFGDSVVATALLDRLMDEAGVEKQVLSPNHPPYLPDEAECVKAVQMLNDGYADLAHRYPQRIASYVMLPLPHIDAALKEMLGAEAQTMLSSGDATADESDRVSFLKHYQEAHGFVHETVDKVLLTVGPTAWPLPFPIVKVEGAWHFDAVEGAKELMYRRIGQNELDAIKVARALYVAQKEYAAAGHDGNSAGVYAQHFHSAPGTESGLYWEAKEGEAESPAGVLVAEATSEGHESSQQTGKRTPFHGYFFRILKAQGSNAPGGEKEYVKDGRMTGGFAILAFPAEYGASGVMTFIAGPRGPVYQKDLGDGTAEAARSITFDPDSSWKLVH